MSAFPADRVEALFKKIDTALSFSGAPSSCSVQESKVSMVSAPPPLRAATEDAKPPEGGEEEGERRKEGEVVSGQHAGLANDAALLTRDVGEGVSGGRTGAAAQVVAAQPAGQPAADEAAQQELRLQRRVLGPKVR